MAKKGVSLRFEEGVIEAVDAAAASAGVSRQVWFDRLVAGALGVEVASSPPLPVSRLEAALHPPDGCMGDAGSLALGDRAVVFGRLSPRAPGGVIGGRPKSAA